jgi:hypothetical protein
MVFVQGALGALNFLLRFTHDRVGELLLNWQVFDEVLMLLWRYRERCNRWQREADGWQVDMTRVT